MAGQEESVASARSRSLLERLPVATFPLLLAGVVVPVLAWSWVWPGGALARFLMANVWGPIKAEAEGYSPQQTVFYGGIATHSGYNVANTLLWGALLAVCVAWLTQVLLQYHSRRPLALILGATAWIVAGSIFHALEDAHLFRPPLQYWFISPPIYLLFGFLGVLSYLMGHHLSRRREASPDFLRLALLPGAVLGAAALGYTVLGAARPESLAALVSPAVAWFIGAGTLAFLVWRLRSGALDSETCLIATAAAVGLFGLAFVALFAVQPWTAHSAFRAWVLEAAALAGGIAALAWLAGKVGAGRWGRLAALAAPVNVLLVGSQALDGLATAFGIDLVGYQEKHVLSGGIMDSAGSFFGAHGWSWASQHTGFLVFVPLKVLGSAVAVLAMDWKKQSGQADTPFMSVIKLAVIMGGIGPGARDLLRLVLGV